MEHQSTVDWLPCYHQTCNRQKSWCTKCQIHIQWKKRHIHFFSDPPHLIKTIRNYGKPFVSKLSIQKLCCARLQNRLDCDKNQLDWKNWLDCDKNWLDCDKNWLHWKNRLDCDKNWLDCAQNRLDCNKNRLDCDKPTRLKKPTWLWQESTRLCSESTRFAPRSTQYLLILPCSSQSFNNTHWACAVTQSAKHASRQSWFSWFLVPLLLSAYF